MSSFNYTYEHGWEVYPLTSYSSLKDGVNIVSYQNGRLHFKVDTIFSAIHGEIRNFMLPADARIPEHAVFQVRENIHGLIDVNMPL